MPCIKRSGKPTKVERMEQTAMKNGYKPGVHEKHGLYIGHWENDMKQGKGKKYYKNKTIYEGDWVANKKQGFGVLMKKVDDHFVFIFEGEWINNRYAVGKLYEKCGVYEGNFSLVDTRMKYGYGIMWWNDGAVYRGQWRDNNYDGRGQLIEVNGNFYYGQWRDGLKHGEGIYVFKDKGQFMEGVWIDDIPRVSMIKNIEDADKEPQRYLPQISKSDEKDIREAYEHSKSEILKTL